MSETYVNRLERIAGTLPRGPCIIALVPTVTDVHAAGLANDFVQRVAHGREGHTLLFSLEDAPSRLDHELGVEGGAGLIDVIHGRLPLARAAASGRARGFIYVPAGKAPGAGADLVRSPAWSSLVDSAVARGGTVVVFMPREVLEAARGAADEPTVRIDGIVWLGPEPADVVWLPWRELGSIDLPDGVAPRGPSPAEPPPERAEDGAARSPAPGVPPLVRGVSRRVRRERERRRRQLVVTTMIVVFLATLAIAAIALVRPDRREAFAPDDPPLWSSPADTGPAAADTAAVPPDTARVSPDASGS